MTKVSKIVTLVMLAALLVLSYLYNAPSFGAVVTIAMLIVVLMETTKEKKEEIKNTYKPRV